MRKILLPVLLIVIIVGFTSCLRDDCVSQREYIVYNPVFMHADQFRTDQIAVTDSRLLESPGKLYFYRNFLLINEMAHGLHVYDVSERTNPVEVAFYNIPGNFDMAIKDDVLFVDNVIDLLALDISDVRNPQVIHRYENYKEVWEPEDQRYHAYNVKSNRVELVDCSDPNFGRPNFWRGDLLFVEANVAFDSSGDVAAPGGSGGSGSGIGGSFARFTIAMDHLYTVDEYSLNVWTFEGNQLEKTNTNNLGWGIETIFPYGDKLFIGSNAGMFIFDNSNPTSPVMLSAFEHATACDPVVVQDNVAFVTLRNGNECQGFVNQMDVVDVTSLTSPRLIKSYPMTNPHGLSVKGDRVYLGEGRYGFRILDVSDPGDVERLVHMEDIPTYDVIALNDGEVFIVGDDGFYIMDATDLGDIKILGHIKVNRS